MAAPKNNEFWKLRSKHGRKKLFETPELLWEAACEYFQWCVDNPLQEAQFIKSGPKAGSMFKAPVMRAFTLQRLCLYLDCSTSYFRVFKSKATEEDQDFLTVIERIEQVIYAQKFEGAAAGLLNPNIIARDLGLVDKKETKHEGGQVIEFVPKNQD